MSRELRPVGPTEEIVRKIAMDVGKQVVAHIDHAHPEVYKAVASPRSFRLSIRNSVHNAIMAAVNAADKGQHEQMFIRNEKHRREMRRLQRLAGGYTE